MTFTQCFPCFEQNQLNLDFYYKSYIQENKTMNQLSTRKVLMALSFLFIQISLFSQGYSDQHDMSAAKEGFDIVTWFGILELPFLLVCIFYSFKVAGALKGGKFGEGMGYLAWGFLVMAIGHLAMQVNHIWGYDIFRDTFGYLIGNILWFIALIITWGLSAIGFYKIYQVARK